MTLSPCHGSTLARRRELLLLHPVSQLASMSASQPVTPASVRAANAAERAEPAAPMPSSRRRPLRAAVATCTPACGH